MAKRKAGSINDNIQLKKCRLDFKTDWLNVDVPTEIPNSKIPTLVKLSEIYEYDESKGIICKFCEETKQNDEFASGKKFIDGWKLDYLKRHLSKKSHLTAVNILRNKVTRPLATIFKNMIEIPSEIKKDLSERKRSKPNEIKILIDNVLLGIKMNNSINSVQHIHDHMNKYVSMPTSWRSKNFGFEFVEYINNVFKEELMSDIRQSKYHTLIIDESTDISVNKMLIIYFKLRKRDAETYTTLFGGIIKLNSCTADSITNAIKDFYETNKLDLKKMVMFTSDGASVMLGKNKGVATQLKKVIPHLIEQHCVAHREDLGITDAWKSVKIIKEIETLLRTVYTVFCRSSVRQCKFKEISSVLECDALSFRPLNEVRWLSRHFAVKALTRNYDALLIYFEEGKEDNDPIAKYCFEKLSNNNYRISIFALNDVLSELSELCAWYQKSCLTPIEATQLVKGKIRKIRSKYLGNKVFWSSEVQNIINSCEDEQYEVKDFLKFVSLLCEHLEKRFPEDELKNWCSFEFDSFSSQEIKYDFGVEEVKNLFNNYKDILNLNSCKTITEIDVLINEYNDYKYLISEKIKTKSLKTFHEMSIYTLKNSDRYAIISQLVDICSTFQASSVECERGFSLMNLIKSKQRNRLGENHLDMTMRIKSYQLSGNVINMDKIYAYWKNGKDRREKIK